jgi:hypothetical protein
MKRIAFALLVGACAAPGALAALKMHGNMVISAVTQGCIDNGVVRAGQTYSFRFRPPNVGGNGPDTSLSIFAPYEAMNYRLLTGSLIGNTLQTVNGTGVFSGGGTFSAKARITSQQPAELVDPVTQVLLTGDIEGFAGEPTCTVTFSADAYN